MAYLARDVIERVVKEATQNAVYPTNDPRDLDVQLVMDTKRSCQTTFFVVGSAVAKYFLHVLGEEYFYEHGENDLHPINDFSVPSYSKDEIESGYIGMTFGAMIYECKHVEQSVFAAVEVDVEPVMYTCNIKL